MLTFNWKVVTVLLAIIVVYEFLTYLLWRGLNWMINPFIPSQYKIYIAILYFIIANATLIVFALRLSSPYHNYTMIWYFYFVYGLIAMFALTLIKFILKFFNINLHQGVALALSSIFLISMTILGLNYAYSPVVKNETIKINKKIEKPIKVALVADLHLGTFFGNDSLEKLNKIVEQEKPDAVIIAGDVMDDNMIMYKQRNMGDVLKKLSAPLGVYATMGNHDLEAQKIVDEISKTGIKPILDDSVKLTDDITIVGRKDKTDKNRMSTESLLEKVDTSKTIILVDHQPDAVSHHSTLDIDVQLSGHTHHGQMWPFNYITEKLYVVDYGYKKINDKHFFTTAGYGFWGPPFKTTARSEVIMITIEGE